MIKITDINGRSHFLSPNDIARITEAGVSSQWHGISAFVKTMDGCTIEARETAVEIAAKLTTAAAMVAKDIHGHGDLTSRIKELEHEAILMLARNGRLEAELAEVRADAERYRWLRDRWGRVTDTYDGDSGRVVEIGTEPDGEGWDVDAPSLDAAIDAALAQQEPPHA